MSKDIKFRVKLNVDGKEQLVTATTTVTEMRKAVRDTQKAFDGLDRTVLNLNQRLEAIGNLGDAFSQLTSGLQQAARQGQALTQLTGATGGDMRALRAETEALAATFGKDFGEVLRSANALSKGFGIGMGDALKLVREGFVVGADAGGDFLDTLREYPRYFKEAGLSAEDFISITANAAKQGVFSDKGVDTIKEANIRLREMTAATAAALDGIGISSESVMQGLRDGSVTTFQVMQQVAARLKELPPSASEVGAAIADIFGGPGEDAGLEYIKSLADVELSLGKVRDAAGSTADAIDAQVGAMETVKRLTGEVADALSFLTPLQPFADMAGQAAMAAMGITSMASAVKGFNVQAALAKARTAALNATALATGAGLGRTAAMTRVFSAALKGTAYSATALKLALRGLLTATVVGAALAALGIVLEKVISALDSAGTAADTTGDKLKGLGQAHDTFADEASRVQAELDSEREKLGRLIKSGGDTTAMVARLNSAYGDAFGYYSTAAQWYDILTRKSKAYAMQLGYEAEARELGQNVAKAQLNVDDINSRISSLYKNGKAYEQKVVANPGGTGYSVLRGGKTKELLGLEAERDKLLAEGRAAATMMRNAMKRADAEAAKVGAARPSTAGGSGQSNGSYGGTYRSSKAPVAPALPKGQMAAELQSYATGAMGTPLGLDADAPMLDASALRTALADTLTLKGALEQLRQEPIRIDVDTGSLDEQLAKMRQGTDAVGQLGAAFSQLGQAVGAPVLDVAGTLAQAIATMALSYAEALKGAAALGPFGWVAFAATGLAQLAAVVSAVKGMAGSYSQGGIVGGSSPTGDRLLARVNSGEMILNKSQQRRMFDMLSGAVPVSLPGMAAPAAEVPAPRVYGLERAPENLTITLDGKLRGRDLTLAVANWTKTSGKSGRRSGINS